MGNIFKQQLCFCALFFLILGCNNRNQSKSQISNDSVEVRKPIQKLDTLKAIKEVTSSVYPNFKVEITEKKKVNDSTFYILCNLSDGVSFSTYIMTFVKDKVHDYEKLTETADQDLSYPYYHYRTLTYSSNGLYRTTKYFQEPADKTVLIDSTTFKKGFDFENVPIKTDSVTTEIKVLPSGKIRRNVIKIPTKDV